jgi:hypothetical protein
MKRSWTIRRTVQELPNGEQRWDRAYQLLLRWNQETETTRAVQTPVDHRQEGRDESSTVRASVDPTTSSEPNN